MRPYMVEVLGTPEAGKTTAIKSSLEVLRQKGYQVDYIRESAEIIPPEFPKNSIDAHFWIRMHIAQSILLSRYSHSDIVIIDRGIIDTFVWNHFYCTDGKLDSEQLPICDSFFSVLHLFPQVIVLLTTTPEESIRRRGGEGRIVTKQFVTRFNQQLSAVITGYSKSLHIPVFQLDTTTIPEKVVADFVANVIERQYNTIHHDISS